MKKFKKKLSIPIQICLSKNNNIQIHQYIETLQDLNRNSSTCLPLVIFMYWACEGQRSIFLVLRLETWATSVQSSTLWQQATIEIIRRDHSFIALRVTYICVLLFVHTLFVVNHTFNAMSTERLQQHPLLFAINRTCRTFFLWMLHLAPPSQSGQSSKHCFVVIGRLNSKCVKLLTMAASNNRDPTLCWFYFSLFAPHIDGCRTSRTSRLWWIAHFNTTLTESLQHLK